MDLVRKGTTSTIGKTAYVPPEIVHVHNTFPLASASVLTACRQVCIPVVATVQNTDCYMRRCHTVSHGRICHECLPDHSNSVWPGIRQRAYQHSLTFDPANFRSDCLEPRALANTSRGLPDAFERPAIFAVADSMSVCLLKPNFVPTETCTSSWRRRLRALSCRLAPEKGINVMHVSELQWQPDRGKEVDDCWWRSA